MSKELVARMRQRRELVVEVGRHKFTVRRPTDVEAISISNRNSTFDEIAAEFVCGWAGVTEDDLIGGGGSDEVKFTPDLWQEWCPDNPTVWKPIALAALAAYQEHAKLLEDTAKN
jgi:hypothetical protein